MATSRRRQRVNRTFTLIDNKYKKEKKKFKNKKIWIYGFKTLSIDIRENIIKSVVRWLLRLICIKREKDAIGLTES